MVGHLASSRPHNPIGGSSHKPLRCGRSSAVFLVVRPSLALLVVHPPLHPPLLASPCAAVCR